MSAWIDPASANRISAQPTGRPAEAASKISKRDHETVPRGRRISRAPPQREFRDAHRSSTSFTYSTATSRLGLDRPARFSAAGPEGLCASRSTVLFPRCRGSTRNPAPRSPATATATSRSSGFQDMSSGSQTTARRPGLSTSTAGRSRGHGPRSDVLPDRPLVFVERPPREQRLLLLDLREHRLVGAVEVAGFVARVRTARARAARRVGAARRAPTAASCSATATSPPTTSEARSSSASWTAPRRADQSG